METLDKLVLAAQANDHDAYDKLVSSFQDMAYAIACTYLKDHHLAQDAVQNALLEAFIHLPQLKVPGAFSGWFRQIVFHQCTRMTRHKSFDNTLTTDTTEIFVQDNPECVVELHEMQSHVHNAIRLLPEHERQVTALFYIHQYSQHEISTFLDIPVNTVKKRLYSARQKLKKCLEAIIQDGIAVVYFAWLSLYKEDVWKTNHLMSHF